ncbi:MAG TPA: biotin--[acetyl-CoA-carboxylase] ligase [Stellaceae bacterium]|nr:biotin--[acetyl-CoA-carboxylase] ligase [Stellaceae bacterium]
MRPLPALPPFYRLLCFERIDSTNDEAKRLAAAAAAEGTLVWAEAQSAGRGRRGRAWLSPPGNLYVSLLLRPRCGAGEAAQLGFAAAIAVAETCASFLPAAAAVRLKWPNDVLVGGRKIAGILLESSSDARGGLDFLVLGIGVNLAAHPEAAEFPATSLAALGATVTPAAMLVPLAERLLAWYETWRGTGFAAVRAAWLDRAEGLGAPIRVRLASSELNGRFAGLDESGILLLDGAGGRRRIAAAEIFPAA